MNDIPKELCERYSYVKTKQLLEESTGNRERLDDFAKFLKTEKDKNKENVKYRGKVGFDVSTRFLLKAFLSLKL